MFTRRQLLAAGASVLPTAMLAKGASRGAATQVPIIGSTAAHQDYIQHLKQANYHGLLNEPYRRRYELFSRTYCISDDVSHDIYVRGITSLLPHAGKDVAIGHRDGGKFERIKIVALWDEILQEFIVIPVSSEHRVTREHRDDCIFLGEDTPGQPRFIDVYETESCDPRDIINWSALPV